MSDTHDDPPPNPAALDELLRAFAERSDPDEAADRSVHGADEIDDGGDPTAPSNPPLEIHIVEQTPPEPAPGDAASDGAGSTTGSSSVAATGGTADESAPPETVPTIIRIDDLGGGLTDRPISERLDGEAGDDRGGDDAATGDGTGPDVAARASAATGDASGPTIIRIDDLGGGSADRPGSERLDDEAGAPAATGVAGDVGVVGEVGEATDGTSDSSGASSSGGDAEPSVISITDEDLPDAVYVEGNLERSGTRTIVFIEDDDTGDTVATDPERDRRRGVEPRIRERRAAVKRAIGRKRLRWLIAIAAVLIVGVGTLAVLGSSLFSIRAENVTVFGAVYTDDAELDAVIDDLVGTPTLLADTEAAELRLEAIPWVDSARVRTEFPRSVTIDIREREAMTTYQGRDQRYRVLDREGRVLDVLTGRPIAYLELKGPDPVDLDAGEFAPQGYAAASEFAKNLTGSVRGRVDWIDVTADGSRLSLLLTDGTEVRFGAARDLFAKLVRLETVLASDADREPGVIDVSTREVTL